MSITECLPPELLGKILSFDSTNFYTFSRLSRETHQMCIQIFKYYKDKTVRDLSLIQTSLYQRIASFANLAPEKFCCNVYTYASLYGGKWQVYASAFASPKRIRIINEKIQEKKNENLISLWKILCPLVQLTRELGGAPIPGIEASPEAIETWMERNQDFCYGITLRSLPLCKQKLDLLENELELLTGHVNAGGEINRLDGDAPVFSNPILIESERSLKFRLAEEMDRLLRSQGFAYTRILGLVQRILDDLRELFQECQCPEGRHLHTAINVIRQKNGAAGSNFAIELQHSEEAIDANKDSAVTLHFHVTPNDFTRSFYFDESLTRAKIAKALDSQMVFRGFTEEDRYRSLPLCTNQALNALRILHQRQARANAIPNYLAAFFSISRRRNRDGVPIVDMRPFPSVGGMQLFPPINSSVTLRFYP